MQTTALNQQPVTFRPLPALPSYWLSLGHAFVHQAKTKPQDPALSDTTGVSLNYRETLLKSVAVANLIEKEVGDEEYVGVLLPPSVGAALVNIALTLLGKVSVNLNYTSSQRVFDSCIKQSGIKHIITSKKVQERFKLESEATLINLEDLSKKATVLIKARSWTEAELVPEKLMGLFLPGLAQHSDRNRLDDIATVIFTAGSTGDPKGVMLTHRNVLSNLLAIKLHKRGSENEVVLGVAPFFHAFGYTAALWTVLALGYKGVYHPDPFDALTVGKLCAEHKVSILFCTPTMMRAYARRCKPEQFRDIKFLVAGGEKLKPSLAQEINKNLEADPLEGYGLTETSPVIACTLHIDIEFPDGRIVPGSKPGSVGIPLPGTEVKIVSLDTDETLPAGQEGMVLVRGPQIMKGYLNKPEETAKVMRDGWFITNDLGILDKDGYLSITGRMSQFSKIGGEMVPHLAVEKEIAELTGVSENFFSVTSCPCPKKGEKLAVVYTDFGMTPEDVVKKLQATEISKLWIPDAINFVQVKDLPVLGTGKIDLRKIKDIAAKELESKSA
jgi:acyl-[acyl-carrier-protein]-phospholipid O-acyltransferase / long-chain-fatty-acid--[acyl-carrier-protein] ligase